MIEFPEAKLAAPEVTTWRAEGKLGVAVEKYLAVRYHILLGEKVAKHLYRLETEKYYGIEYIESKISVPGHGKLTLG